MCPHPTHGDHDLNKIKFTLPAEDASTQVKAFLADQFLKRFKINISIDQ